MGGSSQMLEISPEYLDSVREKVTCEGMIKSLVILRAGVYIELWKKVNNSISTAWDAVKYLVA
jgi:hypothetical protein